VSAKGSAAIASPITEPTMNSLAASSPRKRKEPTTVPSGNSSRFMATEDRDYFHG
jgi:hypothetical protein